MSRQMHTLEERITRLEALEEIKTLQARYARALDDGFDAETLVALFLPDGAFDGTATGGARTVGRDALYAMWSAADKSFRWAFHYMISPTIQLDYEADVASGHWYLLECATLRGEEGDHSEWQGCTYDIAYRRANGAWLFEEMRIVGRFRSRNLEGWLLPST